MFPSKYRQESVGKQRRYIVLASDIVDGESEHGDQSKTIAIEVTMFTKIDNRAVKYFTIGSKNML
jgi:hypothetical protein